MASSAGELFSSLRKTFHGDLLRPDDQEYETARSVWNGMVARSPGLIARCADVSDVQAAVKTASEMGILTAVRCGGHSLAGFSTCEGGLVIDLSRMRDVQVDASARRARFAGGCLLGSIDTATQKGGLVFPSGVVSHTGAAGLVLGGGTGWLTRRFGLSCDNVLGFSLVTADGSLLRANEKENPDLYWALRGGGGNFGVVTEFEVRLHSLMSVILGEGLTPESQVRETLHLWRDFMPGASHDLKWNVNLRLAADSPNVPPGLRNRPVASHGMVWTGAEDRGRPVLQRPLSTCAPETVKCRAIPFLELQTMADSDFPHGRRYYTKSGYFSALTDSTIDRLMHAASTIPSPETMIELAYLGGAASEIGATETAFGDRSAPFVLTVLANWAGASEDEKHVGWVRGVFRDLQPAMKPGVYVNFMSADEQDRVPEAYHERWERMVEIKSRYDAKNFFRLNQNVRPRETTLPQPQSTSRHR